MSARIAARQWTPCRHIRPLSKCLGHHSSSGNLSRQCRRYLASSSSSSHPRSVAILGAGLTGLTTAYYLAKLLPKTTRITIYEASDRVGGWVRSDRVPVDVAGVRGNVLFERGPRTLSSLHTSSTRFDDLVLYDLALDLGLRIASPHDQPRYIYHNGEIVCMPPHASLVECLSKPLFVSAVPAVAAMVFKRLLMTAKQEELGFDFSIAEFMRRVSFGNALSDNFASAMIHGIYGGDIERLSAQSVLGDVVRNWYLPKLPKGNIYMRVQEEKLLRDLGESEEVRRMAWKANGALLHFGEKGMEALPRAIADTLALEENVEIKLNSPVKAVDYESRNGTVMVMVSTLRPPCFPLLSSGFFTPYAVYQLILTVSCSPLAKMLRKCGTTKSSPRSTPASSMTPPSKSTSRCSASPPSPS